MLSLRWIAAATRDETNRDRSGDDVVNDATVHVGGAEVAAAVAVSQRAGALIGGFLGWEDFDMPEAQLTEPLADAAPRRGLKGRVRGVKAAVEADVDAFLGREA